MAFLDSAGGNTPFSSGATDALFGASNANNQFMMAGAQSAINGYANRLAAKEMAKAYKNANKSNIWGNVLGGVAKIAGGVLGGPAGAIGAGLASSLFGGKNSSSQDYDLSSAWNMRFPGG